MADVHSLPADMADELTVESHAPYIKIWAILAVLTAVEYVYAMIFKDHFAVLVLGLVSLALVKAGMVGWFFMHLKFERKWVYILIIPACVMAVFLTLALCPDMAMKPVVEENPGEDEAWTVPSSEADGKTCDRPRLAVASRSHRAGLPRSFRPFNMNVSRSYGRGILIVAFTVLASAAVVLAGARSAAVPPRAAQDLGDQAEHLGAFEFVERSGRKISDADLADRVCIVSFIFTRCQLSCPRISSVMKSLQARLEGSDVLLVSLSVDPEHDTPEVLSEYARRFEAEPDRWWFLTGSRPLIYNLIQRRFKLSVMENPAPEADGNAEAVAHSDRLALVDHGRVVGLFDSNEPAALGYSRGPGKTPSAPKLDSGLAHGERQPQRTLRLFLIIGWCLIRSRDAVPGSRVRPEAEALSSASVLQVPRVRGHIVCMALAVLTSTIFLMFYLIYHYHAGSMPFRGQGLTRLIYFTVLLSHTVLATFGVVPLVVLTLLRALRRDFARHRLVAATTFPIWVYVSITGVVIYLMLYHLPIADSGSVPSL